MLRRLLGLTKSQLENRLEYLQVRCRQLSERNEYLERTTRPNSATRMALMEQRIANLEATLNSVLTTARGDGREATTHEFQMTMRTARAILEDELPDE